MSSDSLPPVYCSLVGVDSNAFSLMAHWAAAARKARWPRTEVDRVLDQARAGDYDHLIAVLMDNSTHPLEDDDLDDDLIDDDEVDDEEEGIAY